MGNRDLRSGLILIAVGVALMIFFNQIAKSSWAIGLIPGLIGVAFIASWFIERRLQKEPGPNGN
jgi:hypothetical protein